MFFNRNMYNERQFIIIEFDFAKFKSRQTHIFNKLPNIKSANICSYTVYHTMVACCGVRNLPR